MKVLEMAFCVYPITDLKRARGFYEGVLGLKETIMYGEDKGAWVEYDLGSTTLALCNMVPEWKASPGGGCVAFEVEDFEEAVRDVKAAGVGIVNGPMETPVCHMVTVSDPDGNSVTLHKRKG